MLATRIRRSLFGAPAQTSSDPAAILATADAARDRGDWAAAAQEYRRYLDLRPDHADIWVQLGNMHKEQHQVDSSLSAYRRALALGLNTSDTHLQLGHLYKLMGDRQSAMQYYLHALDLTPFNCHAFEELEHMGLIDQASDIILRSHAPLQRSEPLVLFDISDLVCYIGHHDNLSGIQRVQCCVIQAVMKYALLDPRDVRFVSFDHTQGLFRSVCADQFIALLDDLARPPERRTVEFDAEGARAGRLFPQEPLAAVLRPGRTTVVLLGAAWVIPEYSALIVNLKRRHGVRFAMLFHDFIPIYARETCDQGTAVVFREFVDQVLPVVDLAMCVSQSTERDLKRYCRESGRDAPPSLVTRLGTSFDEFFPRSEAPVPAPRRSDKRARDPFVLFVSTIEGRKNHIFMFDVWRALAQRGVKLPRLVCVGRFGWRAEAFLTSLFETDYLDGRIELREDVSDEALNALYAECLFTVFPSVYEGWGLPIGESLGHGKLCVLADNSSLPEVAGEFGCFIPLDDVEAAADTIAGLLGDPDRLAAYEAAIAERFAPLRWEEVARTVIEGCQALDETALPTNARPLIAPGTEYTLKRLQVSFDGLTGRAMIEAMEDAFSAPILGGHTRAAHRVAGLLARDERWFPAERWGSWARDQRARLQFRIDPESFADEREIMLYGAFTFVGPVLGSRLRLLIGGVALGDERMVDSQSAVLAWSLPLADLRRRCEETPEGMLAVDFGFELVGLHPGAIDASRAIDARGLTFGLRSFVLLGGGAMTERLRIAERNGYALAC